MKIEFDSFGSKDCYIEYIENPDTPQDIIKIVQSGKTVMEIVGDRDQWGLFISFYLSGKDCFTIAQEDQTRSFIDALIIALTKLKSLTFETTSPTVSE
jgi:hypothetical protein